MPQDPEVAHISGSVTGVQEHKAATEAVRRADFCFASLTTLVAESPAIARYRYDNAPELLRDAPWWAKEQVRKSNERAQTGGGTGRGLGSRMALR